MNIKVSKNLAEHLGPAWGTLVFRGTVVGNHCARGISPPDWEPPALDHRVIIGSKFLSFAYYLISYKNCTIMQKKAVSKSAEVNLVL